MDLVATKSEGTVFHLPAFEEVWEYEEADIKNFLSGNHSESKIGAAERLGEKLGISKSGFQAVASLIPGGMAAALVGELVIGGGDLLKGAKLDEAAMNTRQLIQLAGTPCEDIDWDFTAEAVQNLQTWLLPRISERHKVLTTLVNATSGHEEVAERLRKYEAAIRELEAARDALVERQREFEAAWSAVNQGQLSLEKEMLAKEQEAKRAVEAGVKALLWDLRTAERKIQEIEAVRGGSRCQHSRFLSRCDRLALSSSQFCPDHVCDVEGCEQSRVVDSYYCSKHSKIAVRNARWLKMLATSDSMLEADNGRKPQSRGLKGAEQVVNKTHTGLMRLPLLAGAILVLVVAAFEIGSMIKMPAWLEKIATGSHVAPQPSPSVIPANGPGIPVPSQLGIMARYDQLHEEKPFAMWDEDDMARAVHLLASAKGADLDAVRKVETETLKEECSTGSCVVYQREFKAARRLRDGSATTVEEALRP